MRYPHRALLTSIVLATSVAFGSAPDANDWQVFQSPDGRFSAAFPGAPTKADQESKTKTGESLVIHGVSYSNERISFNIMWFDNTKITPDNAPQMLEAGRDAGLKTAGGALLSSHMLTLEGDPALEYTALLPGVTPADGRMIAHGSKLYVLMAVAKTTTGHDQAEPDIHHFFDSFKLLSPAWKEYASKEHHFSILFPETPKSKETPLKGQTMLTLTASDESGNAFSLNALDEVDQARTADQIYDASTKAMVAQESGQLLFSRTIRWLGQDAREIRTLTKQGAERTFRLVIVGHRYFILGAGGEWLLSHGADPG